MCWKSLIVTDCKANPINIQKNNYRHTLSMPTCITYLNFNIVDLLVWAVLRLAEVQNKETVAKSMWQANHWILGRVCFFLKAVTLLIMIVELCITHHSTGNWTSFKSMCIAHSIKIIKGYVYLSIVCMPTCTCETFWKKNIHVYYILHAFFFWTHSFGINIPIPYK